MDTIIHTLLAPEYNLVSGNIYKYADQQEPIPHTPTVQPNQVMTAMDKYLNLNNYEKQTPTEQTLDQIVLHDSVYLMVKAINQYENENSKKYYTRDFMIRMKYNHGYELQYKNNIKIIEGSQPLEPNKNIDTTNDITEMIDCELISPLEYSTTSDTLHWRTREKFKLFYEEYYINGISNLNTYNPLIYESVNTEHFYETYYKNNDIKNQYTRIKHIFGNTLTRLQHHNTEHINTTTEAQFTNIPKEKALESIAMKLLDNLNIDIQTLPKIITNYEYDNMILKWKSTLFHITELQKYYTDNKVLTDKHNYDITNKKFIPNMKSLINAILGDINIKIKYIDDKNTTRSGDKMIINFKDFKTIKCQSVGRLCEGTIHITHDMITKTRNTFKYNGFPVIKHTVKRYDNDIPYVYYTQYKLLNSKALLKFLTRNVKSKKATKPNEMFKKVLIELLFPKITPIIISQTDYQINYHKMLNEVSNIDFDLLDNEADTYL